MAEVDRDSNGSTAHSVSGVTSKERESSSSDHTNKVDHEKIGQDEEDEDDEDDDCKKSTKENEMTTLKTEDANDEYRDEYDYDTEEDDSYIDRQTPDKLIAEKKSSNDEVERLKDPPIRIEDNPPTKADGCIDRQTPGKLIAEKKSLDDELGKLKDEMIPVDGDPSAKEAKMNTPTRIFSLPNPYYKGPNKCARGKLKSSAKSLSSSSSPFVASCVPSKGKRNASKAPRFSGDFDPREFTCKIGNRDESRKSYSSFRSLNHMRNPFGPGCSSDTVRTETVKNPFARARSRTAPPDELTLMFVRVMDGLPPFEEEPSPETVDDDVGITSNQGLPIEPNDASAGDDIILQEFNEKAFYDYLSNLPDEPSDEQIDPESNPCDLIK